MANHGPLLRELETPDRTSEIDAGGVELKECVNEVFSHAKDAVRPLVSAKWLAETMVAWRAKSSFFVTI